MPRIGTVTVVLAAGLALGAALVVAWFTRPEPLTGPCTVATGPASLPELTESSGLAVSRRTPGVIWSHNDSGNESVLYAVDTAGTVHGRLRVPARTRDWEDISAARCPAGDCLYIADIGDNREARAEIVVYRVPEPAPGDAVAGPPDIFRGSYADGTHNSEAMVATESELFIITRDRVGRVFRSAIPAAGGDIRFERAGQLGLRSVTDAEASPDGHTIVVRTSREVAFYRSEDFVAGRYVPMLRLVIDGLQEPQGEGVAMDGNVLYLSSEGRPWSGAGLITSLRCDLPK